jgi:cobalt-zinc-cadmium efflux system outer membrane protein
LQLLLFLALAASSCAAVDPTPRWERLDQLVRSPTGEPLVWERDPEDAERIRRAVEEMLADGLSRSEAIRVALLDDRGLQATFEKLGTAEAHRVQAGLLTNPSLSVALAFPMSLGDSSAALLGVVSDLWIVPVEEALAENAAEQTVRGVAARVVATAADAARAYDEVLLWTARRHVEAELADVERTRLERIRGASSAPDGESKRFAAEDASMDQEIALESAELELALARITLAGALGLPDERALPRLTDALAAPPPSRVDAAAAVPFALAHRFDVATAALAVAAAEDAIELERRQVWGNVGVGPSYQGGFGQEDAGGPALGMSVPLFDQNQAQIARAEYELRRCEKQLEETRIRARTEVLRALAEVAFRRRQEKRLQARSARASEMVRGGRSGPSDPRLAPSARHLELTARRDHLASIVDLREAEMDLHLALWGAARFSDVTSPTGHAPPAAGPGDLAPPGR